MSFVPLFKTIYGSAKFPKWSHLINVAIKKLRKTHLNNLSVQMSDEMLNSNFPQKSERIQV